MNQPMHTISLSSEPLHRSRQCPSLFLREARSSMSWDGPWSRTWSRGTCACGRRRWPWNPSPTRSRPLRTVDVSLYSLLSRPNKLSKRLPSNIGLLLRMLRVVVCFHSRHLMICKHGLFTANRWAKRPWNMPDTRMFTNSKASAMEADNNSQHTQ